MTYRYIPVLFILFLLTGVADSASAQSAFFLTSSKQTVRELRESVTLNWDATAIGADSCEASGFWKGKRPVTGMEVVRPWIDGNYYALKCTPRDAKKKPVTLSVTVNVDKDVLPDYGGFPAIDIDANPTDVEEGGSTTLVWDAKGADYCFGYHSTFSSSGDVPDEWSDARGLDPKGSMVVHPRKSGRYQISCQQLTKTSNYASSADVYVTVGPKKPTVSLSISKQSLEQGEGVDISWLASQAESCYGLAYIPNKDGYFSQVDFGSPWNSNSLSSQGTMRVFPTVSTQYYVNCGWKNERGERTYQRAASKVIVTQHGADTTPKAIPLRSPTIISFSAEPLTVNSGEKVTAYWNARDAEQCHFTNAFSKGLSIEDGNKQLSLSGSDTFTPLKSGRYGISCTAQTYARGEFDLDYTTTARDEEWVDIVVNTPQEAQKKQEQERKTISISFTTNRELVPKGQTAMLEWNAINATRCIPKGPSWWKGERPSRGTFEVKPSYTSTYQLQCVNDSVSPPIKKTASLSIEVISTQSPSWLIGNTTQKPVIEFKSNKTQLALKESVTFSWIASYAESCRGEGGATGWEGKKKASGSHTLYLRADYEVAKPYRLICSNRNGTTTSKEIALSFKKPAKKK